MKIRIFLLFVTVLLAGTVDLYGQSSSKLSVSATDMELRELFKTIGQQSDYMFFFVDTDIDGVRVSVNAKDVSVEMLLNQALAKTGLVYSINDRYITILSAETAKTESAAPQQNGIVSGTVTDESGNPIAGVMVSVDGANSVDITDTEGKYSIEVRGRTSVLVFSFLGYTTRQVAVGNRREISVTMSEDVRQIEDIVVVGYGTQKKGYVTGSVVDIKADKLTIAPVSNVTQTLGGQLPGLFTKNVGGQPGSDMVELNVRGFGKGLVIVDGVEASFTNIDPSQIESISILKDGAASIYGVRGSGGVILVTTKRGTLGKPTITLNSSYTLQGVTKMLKPASSGQWAEMEREAWTNAGSSGTAPWTQEEVDKFYAGNDPAYPNSAWYDFIFRRFAPQHNHNLSIRGGSEAIKYYGFIGYTDQETMIRTNGGDFNRFNIQSNIDAKVTKGLTLSVDLSLIYENHYFSHRGINNGGYMWNDFYASKPWFPTTLPDPAKISYAGLPDTGSAYAMSNTEIAGYDKIKNRNIKGGIALEYDFSQWAKGLKAKAYVNYRDDDSFYKGWWLPVASYTYNPENKEYTLAKQYEEKAKLSESVSRNNILTQQYSLSYENVFGDHRISALAVSEMINYNSNYLSASRRDYMATTIAQLSQGSATGKDNGGGAGEMGRTSFVGRVNYGYKDKYLLEAIFRADASAKFDQGYKWGYFPGVSLGWVVSQEGFMDNVNFIDNLKLRASFGASGNDDIDKNFAYLAGYAIEPSNTYILGTNRQTLLYPTDMANPLLSWERMKIYNVGLDFSLFRRKLYGTAEYFYRDRDGIPASRKGSLPSTFGANLPTENLNSISTRGFEVSLGTAQRYGNFSFDISGNISWARSRYEHYEEPQYTDPEDIRLNKRTGEWTDALTHIYITDGLFTSQDEIDGYPQYQDAVVAGGHSALRPGDIKVVDKNKDGKIDRLDLQKVDYGPTPLWMYGFNVSMKYKGFDLSALLQGAFGYVTNIYGLNMTETLYETRWTEKKNDARALVPRLGGKTAGLASDYYHKNTSYLRLKNLAIGYSLPTGLLSKAGISQLRIYLAGTNLLTFSNLNKYGIDPEAPYMYTYYPQQRTYSIGLNLSF